MSLDHFSGALISGGSVMAEVTEGNATMLPCSQAMTNMTQHRPLRVLNWGQISESVCSWETLPLFQWWPA